MKTAPAPLSPRDVWWKGCYAEISLPVDLLRSRRVDLANDPDGLNPWIGQTLKSVLLTAVTGGRVVDVSVKVIVQNRAAWGTTFYVGRLTLEDTNDVRRRYELQDWLNAMKPEDRDKVMSMLSWDTDITAAAVPKTSTAAVSQLSSASP